MQVRPGHAGTIGMDGPFLRCSRTAEERPDGLSRRVIIAAAGLIGQGFIAALEFDTRQGAVAAHVVGCDVDDDSTVGDAAVTPVQAHAIGDDPPFFRSRADDDTAGTHAQPYGKCDQIPPVVALQKILGYLDRHGMETLHTSTQIIIAPGYDYKIVKAMVTNFHQPQSTLLLLVSAFVKGNWRTIYDYALSHDFRFLSYGDSSLLIP